jgi:hypothetical protein
VTAALTVELLYDVASLALGDLLREPGRKTWRVVLEHVPGTGPDGVRQRGCSLEITVSMEAMRRATHGEHPAEVVRTYAPMTGEWKDLPQPLERIRDPIPR